MDIRGKNALVLGGFGLVGRAVWGVLWKKKRARLVVASQQKKEAKQAVAELKAEFPKSRTKFFATWGDIFLRAEWRTDNPSRADIMGDSGKRAIVVGDIVDDLSDEILTASLLFQIIQGQAKGL